MGHYDDGKSSLAKTVNGLGVLHYLQKRYEEVSELGRGSEFTTNVIHNAKTCILIVN